MKVSRITAMAMWRIQLKSFPWNNICWMARRTWGQVQGITLHPWSQEPYPAGCRHPYPYSSPVPMALQVTITPFPSQALTLMPHWSLSPLHSLVLVALPVPITPASAPALFLAPSMSCSPIPVFVTASISLLKAWC